MSNAPQLNSTCYLLHSERMNVDFVEAEAYLSLVSHAGVFSDP